ncbi:PAS domain S-box protein [Haloplanus aerogenes]|uniref:histidine kinase n=1 Tax=Haloplanus aerogenes TaxID=660522 RepID=A0A3M0DF53_9EURY|nr:PAS domain S-box protein [Haloplanus aerogenes]AZH24888.1 PAS domain S-box protein [Haloplanus aerogenes]RMB13903.1 PAS domain S-box-containing protein [Haloplanus aerogenes]
MSTRPGTPLLVLLVDGNGVDERATALEREHPRFEVLTASGAAAGLAILDERSVDCVVSGVPLDDRRGGDLLAAVRNRDSDRPFLLLTDGEIDADDAFAAGITDYVPRAADPVVLATRITTAVGRCRTDRELAAARERYDLVARASADAFLEWDLDANAVRRCDGFVDTFGYAPAAVEPSFDWWVERVHPDDRDRVTTHLSMAADGDLDEYEDVYRFRDGDGTYAYVLARAYCTDDGDDGRRMIGILTDITKQIEYLARFRELIEHSLDTIAIVDDEGTITYISPSVEQVTGGDPAALVGTAALDRVHPADRERVAEAFEPLLNASARESGPIEYRIHHADGEWTWVESVARVPNDSTLVDGILVNTRNVTERKAREARLQRLEQAIDQTGAAVYMTDADGTIEYVNPSFEELTGYTSAEAVGETTRILNSGEQDAAYYQHLWETVESGEVWEETIVDQRRSGEKYTAVQTIGPIVDDGSITGYVAIQTDITDELLDEQRVGVLNRMLRHNLRNGLNVVQGHVDFVAERVDDDELRDALQTVTDRCNRLLAESEKARRFQTLLNAERYTPRPVWEVLANLRRETDRLDDASVTITVDPAVDGAVLNVIDHALVELVENAVEHTNGDTAVTVEVRLIDAAEFEFVVTDDGAGLPAMERRVLETGAETPLEHSQGLGLWLTHWLVQIAGGSVEFADNDPSGTVIRVRVPRL